MGVSRRGWFILGSWPAWVVPVPRASVITSLRSHAAAMDETPSSATDVAKGKLPVNLRPLLPAIDPKESSSSSPSPLPSFSGLTKRPSPTPSACSSCRKRKAKVSVIPNSGADRLLKPWTKVQRTPARVQTMLPTYTRLPIRDGRRRRDGGPGHKAKVHRHLASHGSPRVRLQCSTIARGQ